MLRYWTAGESHGKALVALVDGFPAGVAISTEPIDEELRRRQGGYGRGGRQRMESDRVEILSGLWKGQTLGSPIALLIPNKDYKLERMEDLAAPRPGHGDLSGAMKYLAPIRAVLERASARETAARVAVGALAGNSWARSASRRSGYVVELGPIRIEPRPGTLTEQKALRDASELFTLDPGRDEELKRLVDAVPEGRGHARRRDRGAGRGGAVRAGLARPMGPEARRADCPGRDVGPGDQGGGDRAGIRGGTSPRLPGPRPDPLRSRPGCDHDPRVHAAHQQCRRAGSGHDQRPADRGPRRHEADQHAWPIRSRR